MDRTGTKSYALKRRAAHLSRLRKLLGKRLRQARKDADLSQAVVGCKLGQGQTLISKIEGGLRGVEFGEVEEFAFLYGKKLMDFATPTTILVSKSLNGARKSAILWAGDRVTAARSGRQRR